MSVDERISRLRKVPGERVFLVRPDGRVVATADRAGDRPVELAGGNLGSSDLIHPKDRAIAEKHWRQVTEAAGNRGHWELRVDGGDGSWRWIDVTAVNATDDPVLDGIVVSCRDIHPAKQAEEALRSHEQRLRAIVEHSRDVAALLDDGGTIVWCSPGVTQMLGWTVDELVGTNAFQLVHPDDLAHLAERFADSIEPENPEPLTLRFSMRNGGWKPVEAAAAQWPIDEDLVGLVVNLRDVERRERQDRALRDSEELFRSLTDSSPMGIYRAMPSGDCIYVNERWQEITGYTADEAMGMGWHRMIHPDDRHVLEARQGYISETHEPLHFELRVLRPDGSTRWVSIDSSPIFEAGGEFAGTAGTLQDITDRVTAQRDSARLTDIFEATQDVVAMADRGGRVLYLNKAARQFFGIEPTGGLDQFDLMSHFPPDMVDRLVTEIQPALEEERLWQGEFSLLRPDGSVVPHSGQILVHLDEAGRAEFFSAILHDISERKVFEHRLAHQATHDPLTGLPNRTLLLDRLEMAVARARRHRRRLAVLFLDLDHFKVVNDSLGHGLGDRLLIAIASRLHAALRPDDTVARFGGDEFVVLCEDLITLDDATIIADRIHEALSGPFVVDDAEVFVGVSIGIAFPDDPDTDPEALIRDADAAMYQAKARGRARWVVFDNAMRASAVDRLDIENALRRALDRRELRVYYQPIIQLSTGRVTGVEALLRWEHPERGLLLPGDFITVAEETGLIVPIGTWVLNQACRQVQRWQAAVPELPTLTIAVNLSGRQLGHPNLVADLATTLEETGIDPADVELEITESVLMDDVDMSVETLGHLKGLGVKLAVDDFGTGYSSLSYLRRFPVDLLKVDQSFVDGLGSEAEDSAIVTTIVTLAHNLGLEAVAEGVETHQQLDELRRLSCDRAQGFLIARPAPGHDVGELLLHGERW